MRYYCCLSLLIVCIIGLVSTPASARRTEPDLTAASALLMDYTTGEVLYQRDAFARRSPASTTKILTAIVAMEKGTLNQPIVATEDACKAEGSSIYLKKGERHTLRELLYAILLNSGNDASVAVAENLAGSEAVFAEWMTAKARSIGARNSFFKNSNGLPRKGHYTTAYDLALITRYALRNPVFVNIVKTKKHFISWPGRDQERLLINHNKLLWQYPYADGVKTGYTIEAGHCLASTAIKDGHRLIAVVLKSRNMYKDSKELFEYGFKNYKLLTVIPPHKALPKVSIAEGASPYIRVLPDRTLSLVVPRGSEQKVKLTLQMKDPIKAPVNRLQKVGEIEVKLGNKLIDRVPVVSAADVPKKNIWQKLWEWLTKKKYF